MGHDIGTLGDLLMPGDSGIREPVYKLEIVASDLVAKKMVILPKEVAGGMNPRPVTAAEGIGKA